MREYAARRGWTIAGHVNVVGSGASERQLRVLDAVHRREIGDVLVWQLGRWGRSVAERAPTCAS
jgi:hypothetical protein